MRIDFTILRLRVMLVRHYATINPTWISLPTQWEIFIKIPFTGHGLWAIYFKRQS